MGTRLVDLGSGKRDGGILCGQRGSRVDRTVGRPHGCETAPMSDAGVAQGTVAADSQLTAFERATRAEPLGAHRYGGTMDAGWFGPPGPNGGVIAALILRAMRAEIDDAQRLPRSMSLHYLRPPAEGEVEVEVTVE